MQTNHHNRLPQSETETPNPTSGYTDWRQPLSEAGINPDAIADSATQYMEKASQMIRQHPLEAVGVAAGIGLLAGYVFKHALSNKSR